MYRPTPREELHQLLEELCDEVTRGQLAWTEAGCKPSPLGDLHGSLIQARIRNILHTVYPERPWWNEIPDRYQVAAGMTEA